MTKFNENDIKKLFGKKIKNYRIANKLTQFSLGEKIGINQRQIALIESGKSFPSLKTLIKFADIFACTIGDLFVFENLREVEYLKKDIEIMLTNSTPDKIKIIYTLVRSLI